MVQSVAEEHHALVIFTRIGSWISASAVLLAMICFFGLEKLRPTMAFQMVFFILLNDFIFYCVFGIGDMAQYGEDSFRCQAQAFFINYGLQSAMLWACATAYTLHRVVANSISSGEPIDHSYMMRIFFVLCQLFPVVPSSLPMWFNAYGDAGNWCWVKEGKESDMYIMVRIFSLYGLSWIYVFYCTYIYYTIWQKLRNFDGAGQERKIISGPFELLKFYPLILIWGLLAPTLNRFIAIFITPPYTFQLLHAISSSTFGLLDALFFFYNPTVRREIYEIVKYLFFGKDTEVLMSEYESKISVIGEFSQLDDEQIAEDIYKFRQSEQLPNPNSYPHSYPNPNPDIAYG